MAVAGNRNGRQMTYDNSKRKIPTFFKRAAKILKLVEEKKGLNNLLYNEKGARKECVSAIVFRVLKRQALLEHLISSTGLCEEPNVDPHILKVVLYHGLLDSKRKKLAGNNRPERLVIKHLPALEKCLSDYLISEQVSSVDELDTQNSSPYNSYLLPRYVRVNTLKDSKENVLEILVQEGFEQVSYDDIITYKKFIKLVKKLEPDQFLCDLNFDDLLIFHPKCSFHGHPLYENGTLILQDKSSLLPSVLLKAKPGRVVMDCCAAPGFKTTHLAAVLNNHCTILACDKSSERMRTMMEIVDLHGVTCVETTVNDFTQIDPHSEPYNRVRYILLDPSCSGSGMVKSRGLIGENPHEIDIDRLASLSHFQSALLYHAMSFPKVKRICYSTCSIHAMENEDVIMRALEKFGHLFKLASQSDRFPYVVSVPDDEKYEFMSGKYLKTNPEKDLTNGFFVAVFKRIRRKEESEVPPDD